MCVLQKFLILQTVLSSRLQEQQVIPTLDKSSDVAEDFTAVIRAARSLLKASKETKK